MVGRYLLIDPRFSRHLQPPCISLTFHLRNGNQTLQSKTSMINGKITWKIGIKINIGLITEAIRTPSFPRDTNLDMALLRPPMATRNIQPATGLCGNHAPPFLLPNIWRPAEPSLTTPALPCGVFCSKQWLETYVKFIAIHGKLGPNFEILCWAPASGPLSRFLLLLKPNRLGDSAPQLGIASTKLAFLPWHLANFDG
jgi:hypothetical protein